MKASDYIIQRLAQEGIRDIFLLPGGGAMHLNDALTRSELINAVPCQHEQACGIAAEAYGRLDDNQEGAAFGVALVTSGPGATNILTPVVGAWLESLPLLIISGQAKTVDLMNNKGVRQSGVQEVNIVEIVKSITKYATTILNAQDVSSSVDRALFLMSSGRKGPVWIDIPLDIQSQEIEVDRDLNLVSTKEDGVTGTNCDFSEIIKLIENSKRPLVLAGHGIRLSSATNLFRKWIEEVKIPVALTWPAMDYLSHDSELNIGRPGVVAPRYANFAIQNCDLLISIGARLDKTVTAYNLDGLSRSACKVIVDIDSEELAEKDRLKRTHLIKLDANDFIRKISEYGINRSFKEWIDICNKWKSEFPIRYTKSNYKDKISHAEFVDTLSRHVPENQKIVTGSSGLAVEFFYAGFKNKQNQRIIHTSALGAMGYGLPAAIGVSVASEDFILAIESDGSLQLNIQELSTVRAQNLKICLIIMNNNGYASMRNTQNNYFEGRMIASDSGSGLFIPDFAEVALAHNIPYQKILNSEDLENVLEDIFENKEAPIIIDVQLAENDFLAPKCAAYTNTNGEIISMPLEDMSPLLDLETLESNMLIELTEETYAARK